MNGLELYLLQECYSGVVCIVIILCFIFANHKFDKKIVRLFLKLSIFALIDIIGGKIESYLGHQETYYFTRQVLSWANYIISPGILLIITEIFLRDENKKIKWGVAIPEIINVVVVSTSFFASWCYTIIPETNVWEPGPLIFIPRLVPLLYLSILLVAGMLNVHKKKWESMIISLSCILLAAIVIAEFTSENPISLRETTIGLTLLAYFMYFISENHLDEVQELNENFQEEKEQDAKKMIDHCIETLAYTIDAKDKYTKGHSTRVARYARKIAILVGKSEEECRQIYLAGLLHDIGKISINDSIINKNGKLTEEEYEFIKKHPEIGSAILEKMIESPYLQNGAEFHHERWDGKGYPKGLKGEEIPEYARIISVADSYDAMTSNRSYRKAMNQLEVKQEIWMGAGTQYDPYYAKAMISLIDADAEFDMREKMGEKDEILIDENPDKIIWPSSNPQKYAGEVAKLIKTEVATLGDFVCAEDHWCNPSDGIQVKEKPVKISFVNITRPEAQYIWEAPVVLVYSAEDGKVMGENYEELAVIKSAGYSWRSDPAIAEKLIFSRSEAFESWDKWNKSNKEGLTYKIIARREVGLITISINNGLASVNEQIVMPADYNKPIYIALTGEKSDIESIEIVA